MKVIFGHTKFADFFPGNQISNATSRLSMKNRKLSLAVVVVFGALMTGFQQWAPSSAAATNAGQRSKVDQGAEWPEEDGEKGRGGDKEKDGSAIVRHWAYVKPARPPLPEVKSKGWVRTPIDRFILARLERRFDAFAGSRPCDAAAPFKSRSDRPSADGRGG